MDVCMYYEVCMYVSCVSNFEASQQHVVVCKHCSPSWQDQARQITTPLVLWLRTL